MHANSGGDPVETKVKASKLSIVFLAKYLGAVIKPQEAHDELRNQGRLNFLFNRGLIL